MEEFIAKYESLEAGSQLTDVIVSLAGAFVSGLREDAERCADTDESTCV